MGVEWEAPQPIWMENFEFRWVKQFVLWRKTVDLPQLPGKLPDNIFSAGFSWGNRCVKLRGDWVTLGNSLTDSVLFSAHLKNCSHFKTPRYETNFVHEFLSGRLHSPWGKSPHQSSLPLKKIYSNFFLYHTLSNKDIKFMPLVDAYSMT